MRVNIITIFPEFFEVPLATSIPGRAARAGLASYRLVDLRDFTHDRHKTVDDAPYGGGAGMVMKPEPFFEAVDHLEPPGPVVLLSARGHPFTHADAVRFSVESELTLLCGHYKDVDQRVADHLATEEVSVGSFRPVRRRDRRPGCHRRGRSLASRSARGSRIRVHRLVLRPRSVECALVHEASGVPGSPGARGPPER